MRLSRAVRPSSALLSSTYSPSLSRPVLLAVSSSSPNPSSSSLSTSHPASLRPCRRYSCSSGSSGRSSSSDGSSTRVKGPAAAHSPSPSSACSSTSVSPSSTNPLSTASTALATPQATASVRPTPATYNLPHVSAELVKFDSLFSLHRPLLELPIQVQNRRTVVGKSDATTFAAVEELETSLEKTRDSEFESKDALETITVAELSEELAEVIDLSEDGTPMGSPYLARVAPAESLKSVEEELAAEAKEEESLAMHEEQLHELEKSEAEPYDAWMIGQHEPLPHNVARYLALRPPHDAPQSRLTAASAILPSKILSDLSFLSPFGKPSSSASSDISAHPSLPLPSSFASAFSKHFLRPLEPSDAAAVADQFLSHHQLVHTWAARNDFVNKAAESLRKAEQAYSGAVVSTKSSPVVAQDTDKGTIRYWTEREGWASFDLRTGLNDNESPFLPAELVDLSAEDTVVEMDSTKRKRKKKITKHKYKKRRKAQRALRQRLGK